MKKFILGLSVIFGLFGAQAQQASKIYMLNETVKPNQNWDELKSNIAHKSIQGNVYILLQGKGLELKAYPNFELLNYIPRNTFIASIPLKKWNSFIEEAIDENYYALDLKGDLKLSEALYNNDIPQWAYIGNEEVELSVSYFKNLNHATVRNLLIQKNFKIISESIEDFTFQISGAPNAYKNLMNEAFISYIQEKDEPGKTENYTAYTNHRVNTLQSPKSNGLNYDGSGVVVGLGDDGELGDHLDYTGRLVQSSPPSNGDHGDHVAGTIFGAGNIDPKGRGMAPGADIYYESYPSNLNNVDANFNSQNVRITSSSYSNGCNRGYSNFARQLDQDYQQNPELLHVFSAGNSGAGCSGAFVTGFYNITGGHKIAKSAVTVANLTTIDGLAPSSSRGPARDGRIKPDISAVGTDVYSTTDLPNPNIYTLKTGTSMSCPGVSGTMAVLYQSYRDNNSGSDPDGALLKAIVLNSADDLGNIGPDFKYGWGRINARRANHLIENSSYVSGSLTNGQSATHNIAVPSGTKEVKVMLYWADIPAVTNSFYNLVNDLDMSISFDGQTIQPWVLDYTRNTSALNAPAVRGRDSINNMEQVTFDYTTNADFVVSVNASNIPSGSQDYYIVYEFIMDEVNLTYPVGGEKFVPGETEIIRWDAPDGSDPFSLDYSVDGINWNSIRTFVGNTTRLSNWVVPQTIEDSVYIRLTRGTQTSISKEFNIIGVPDNFEVYAICQDTAVLSWDAVPNATGYVVYEIGAKYMDSISYSRNTLDSIPATLGDNTWYSVSAVYNEEVGQRAYAIEKPSGTFNCVYSQDVGIASAIYPSVGLVPSCIIPANTQIKVEVENTGSDDISGFTVSYQINNGSIRTDTVYDTLVPQQRLNYTFIGSSISLSPTAATDLKLWTNANGDRNPYNDSLNFSSKLETVSSVSLPFTEDFESFSLCSGATNCGQTICNLSNSWLNGSNGIYDDIDWRTFSGPTTSQSTGPSIDQNPGTSIGKYIYLEASGNCNAQLAELYSPCINLNGSTFPVLEFWYHMSGIEMGDISVDLYTENGWINNVFAVAGNQGLAWKKAVIDLSDYKNSSVLVRINGTTGTGYRSDIAIDDIKVVEFSNLPIADFSASENVVCVDGTLDLIDQSSGFANSWKWHITPASFTYINSTDSSQNPSIQLNAAGSYTVQLIASNDNGSDTAIKSMFLIADPGNQIPYFENFASFPPANWEIINPDGLTKWEHSQDIFDPSSMNNQNPFLSKSASYNNFSAAVKGAEDYIISANINLFNETKPVLYFYVAYADPASGSDTLRIDVSSDCGDNFTPTSYKKGGSDLATTIGTSNFFKPQSLGDWRLDSLDLSAYIGGNIKIRFTNISGIGDVLYIKDIQVVDGNVTRPTASVQVADTIACENTPVVFNSTVTGAVSTDIDWYFGSAASPRDAKGSGPHSVIYFIPISQDVSLTVQNDGGQVIKRYSLDILDITIANYGYLVNNLNVDFTDRTINEPTSWHWDFGDGDTSVLQNPSHTYATGGQYSVTLTATNFCGSSTKTFLVNTSGIGINEESEFSNLKLFPNPTQDILNIEINQNISSDIEYQVLDLRGAIIKSENIKQAEANNFSVSVTDLAQGAYIIKIKGINYTDKQMFIKN